MAERIGVSLGVDVGRSRVGLAASDPDGLMANPVMTLSRDATKRRDQRIIANIAEERGARRVFVGLPLNLKGEHTPSTEDAVEYAEDLATRLAEAGQECDVLLIDERLTTVTAQNALREAGISARDQRKMIDQAAAVAILEHALTGLRQRGEAGEPVAARQNTPGPSRGEERA